MEFCKRSSSRIIILLILTVTCRVSAFEFSDSHEEDVEFVVSTGDVQKVIVDESNDESKTVKIVEITDGNDIQLKAIDDDNNNKYLQASVVVIDGKTYVQGYRLDYEQLPSTSTTFFFDIFESGDPSGVKTLSVEINNLDDENPVLTAATCKMKEESVVDINNSNCKLQVSDPDGFLNSMDFTNIEGTNQEALLFEILYKESVIDSVKESDVFVVLKKGKKLDYETIPLHVFHVKATDGKKHPTIPESVQVIVQVEDISDQLPVWQNLISSKRIDEEQETTMTVYARDGDYGIANTIRYGVIDSKKLITIDPVKGEISIPKIDRDRNDKDDGTESIEFSVIAYELEKPTSIISSSITIFINDIDDCKPEIIYSETTYDIDENSNSLLDLNITVEDRDSGEFAMYNIELKDVDGNKVSYIEAFQVVPTKGYGTTPITFTITKPNLLDYETEAWRVITFELHTKGTSHPEQQNDKLKIQLNLIDLNDESPVFEQDGYSVSKPENIKKGELITTVKANDKDQEDIKLGLKYSITNAMARSILEIDETTGEIKTTVDNAFDYEKQIQVSVQIAAEDNAKPQPHKPEVQLIINIIDVNDEQPRLTVNSVLSVNENEEKGFTIDSDISATDVDTTAELVFSIDWDNSYAKKDSSQITNEKFAKFQHCINVETVKKENKFYAILTIGDSSPDYEIFDTLYIVLKVTDTKTELGYPDSDSTTIPISIINQNDNPPEFIDATSYRSVSEYAVNGEQIGTIKAKDEDGNLGNLTFAIEPTEGTPNWVQIEPSTGNLIVTLETNNETIDCDEPFSDKIIYTVSVFDGKFTTNANITIDIIDQNDCEPKLTHENVIIEENQPTDTKVTELKPADNDRTEAYREVRCVFAATCPKLTQDTFKINSNVIYVDLSSGSTLDYETNKQFNVILDCYDNKNKEGPGSQNHITVSFTVQLKDVNDHNPKVIEPENAIPLHENYPLGPLDTVIKGEDGDEEERGQIHFTLIKTQRFVDGIEKDVDQDLFSIEDNKDDPTIKQAVITVTKSLKGLYGELKLTVDTTDLGDPPLSTSDNIITINVAKYNYFQPEILYPKDGDTIYLSKAQNSSSTLTLWTGEPMDSIKATDHQDNKYKILFSIDDSSDVTNLFRIRPLTDNTAELQLITTDFGKEQLYNIPITASLTESNNPPYDGEKSSETSINFNVKFFDENADPTFSIKEISFNFTEEDSTQSAQLPKASYGPDIDLDLPIYYLLSNGDETHLFKVSSTNGIGMITLNSKLDYETAKPCSETETTKCYNLVVQSSNSEKIDPDASDATRLTVIINVIDINDKIPVFDQPNYFSTVVTTHSVNTDIITTVQATDEDTTSKDQLRYAIVETTGSEDGIKNMSPFNISSITGEITLNTILANKKGFFTLNVSVVDEAPEYHKAYTTVLVYLVTEDNTVNFKFKNSIQEVLDAKPKAEAILGEIFNCQSNIENPSNSDECDINNNNCTVAPIYFVKNETPLEGTEIYKQVTNTKVFDNLQKRFSSEASLLLLNFQIESNTNENLEESLKAWLIGVSVVLGSLCLILLVAFILKTRALKQRIKKLSSTKFGSQESGLNRQGIAAPTTNKHAVEGSNPVYNNDLDTKNIERISVGSGGSNGDSDLIGVEDDDRFDYPTKDLPFENNTNL